MPCPCCMIMSGPAGQQDAGFPQKLTDRHSDFELLLSFIARADICMQSSNTRLLHAGSRRLNSLPSLW